MVKKIFLMFPHKHLEIKKKEIGKVREQRRKGNKTQVKKQSLRVLKALFLVKKKNK